MQQNVNRDLVSSHSLCGHRGSSKAAAAAPAAAEKLAPPKPARSSPARSNDGRISGEVLAELHWIASEGSPSLSRRARIVLARHEGRSLSEIADVLDIDRATVRRWLRRFERLGLRGLVHASTGRSRKKRFDDTMRDAIARLAMEAPPSAGRWSLRRLRVEAIRRGIVREVSAEGLRQLLKGLPLPDTYWRRTDEQIGPLGEDVRGGLEALARASRPEVRRRARIVLARCRGLSESEIATALSVGRSCVRRWLQRFRQQGILALQLTRRSPRPLIFTAEVRAAIGAQARMRPEQLGFTGPDWSLRTLRAALVRQHVVQRISIQHLARILAEAGVALHGEPAVRARG
jgi:putative transposase